jgi:hypothetical protein
MLDRKGRSRIIVFTQYKDTMHFVRQQLRWKYGENIACYSGDGGEIYDKEADAWRNVGKERVKREFSNNDGEVDILVCTDSASEGLNLQECGAMINYDLPWNPMRVEQRIGRIDRIGQEYDDVYILNYSYEDTVESDIYDRLDDRIGLFEYVVGDMQPILSSVGSKIREATMVEGAKADSEEYEELERDIDQDIEEQQGEDDPVELKDSLAEVDSDRPLREQVIQEARLDAWETYSHPDLGKVGNPSENRDPVFTVDAAKGVFLENETLTEAGIQFDPLSQLDIKFDLTKPEDAEFIYCLQHPEDAPITAEESEDTLAASIANQHQGIGVTFDPDTADEYSSLRFLAPGSPLFNWLAATLVETSDRLNLTQSACTTNSDGEIIGTTKQPWIVTGWAEEDAADTSLVQLTDGGSVEDRSETVEFLNQWAQEFIENRTKSS